MIPAMTRNLLSASLRRSAAPFGQPVLANISPVRARILHTSITRFAANPQTGKPASDSWSHAKQNIKEEVSGIKSTLESTIAGKEQGKSEGSSKEDSSSSSGAAEILRDARSITGEMAHAVPQPALLWGAAGVIPYISTAGASIWLARKEHLVSMGIEKGMDVETASALLLHAQNIQAGFGAVLLSFLGAIHWGFEFSKYGGEIGNRRYALGVMPLALGWPTLLLAPQFALIAQWAAFVAVWFTDLQATSAGWVPKWYSTYRFWLTLGVGSSIIATLAGTNYYAPGSRSTMLSTAGKLEDEVKADGPTRMKLLKQSAQGNKGGIITKDEVGGDVEATSAGAEGDSYVLIGNEKRKEEERKEQEREEAEKKKKEEAEKKKKKEEAEKKEKEGGDKKEDGGEDDAKKNE